MVKSYKTVKKYLFFFIIYSVFTSFSTLKAQIFYFKNKIKVDFQESSIKYNPSDTTIRIKYNVKAAPNRKYKSRLFYSNNKGNSFKGPLVSISGDIDTISSGKNKEVSWSFRKDNPYFDGKNIIFKLEVTEIPKNSLGGPKNALRSLLIPGWGDTKVRNGYNYGLITIATYSCLITGTIFQLEANKRYDQYLARSANSSEEHDALFRRSRTSQYLATSFFVVGASIWIADIVGVYWKGVKNKRHIRAEKRKLEEENKTTFRLYPYTDGQTTQVTFSVKF
jgi:hypothetical protein